jgi:hypothetical protein
MKTARKFILNTVEPHIRMEFIVRGEYVLIQVINRVPIGFYPPVMLSEFDSLRQFLNSLSEE